MADDSATRLGKMLRVYRFHMDQSVRDLAKEIGTSAATLSRIERGQDMDADTLLKLIHWMRESLPSSPDASS